MDLNQTGRHRNRPAAAPLWLLLALLCAGQAAAERGDGSGTDTLRRADGAVELRTLSVLRLTAHQASRELAGRGATNAQTNARALRAAGYAPADVEAAVAATYRLRSDVARNVTREAFSGQLSIREHLAARGPEVVICLLPDGELSYCPPAETSGFAGSTASGGDTRATPTPAPEAEPDPGPGWLNALNTSTSNHRWINSYLLALLSYYIYSDALGEPAQAQAGFRTLMESWGVDEVRFVDVPNRHLRAAVMRSQSAVIVVFRGSELQTTAHCVLAPFLPGLCPNLPPNWTTNLTFAPLKQRPEWGANVRTHPGFDSAVDDLYSGIMGHVNNWLTGSRRLIVTGHSLGGAMATLFAYRAQLSGKHVQAVYTYGAPRVGNIPFATQYQALLGARTHRWQNRSDPAPAVPPGQPINFSGMPAPAAWSTYRHIGLLHYLPQNGSAELNRTTEPVQLPTRASQVAAGDHWMAVSPDSYARRLHPRLPQSVQAQVPSPP